MGRKRTGKRQHFLLYLACLLIMALGIPGCTHLPFTWQGREHLATAKSLMVQKNFDAALKETEALLDAFPQSMGDEALYLRGLIYAHPQNQNSNWERSMESFQLLRTKYPKSDLIQPTEVMISLLSKIGDMNQKISQLKETVTKEQTEVDNLRTQIEKLKKIDLGIEEKKRRNLLTDENVTGKQEGKNGKDTGSGR